MTRASKQKPKAVEDLQVRARAQRRRNALDMQAAQPQAAGSYRQAHEGSWRMDTRTRSPARAEAVMTAAPPPDIDLEKLERLAKGATPGPWRSVPSPVQKPYRCLAFSRARDEMYTTSALEPADAAYLAALDPATVLALVAAARRAAEMQGWLKWREAWTGAENPTDEHGTPWWRSALTDNPPRGFER